MLLSEFYKQLSKTAFVCLYLDGAVVYMGYVVDTPAMFTKYKVKHYGYTSTGQLNIFIYPH